MGLIKNALNAVGNTMKGVGSQAGGAALGGISNVLHQGMFQEYLVSGDMSGDIIMKRAEMVKANGSKNDKSDANVISDGSYIDVQANQCMIIVENGKVVEACMEPGRYTYKTDLAPSFFAGEGKFGERFVNSAKEAWAQIRMGGMRRNTQRVYFINMGILDKSITWGIGGIRFRHTEQLGNNATPFVLSVKLKGHGTARARVERPLEFFENYGAKYAGGDNSATVTLDSLDTFFEHSRGKIADAMGSAITELGTSGPVAYDGVATNANKAVMRELVDKYMEGTDFYAIGLAFYDFTIAKLVPDEADAEKIENMRARAYEISDINMANYTIQSKMAEGFMKAGENGGVSGIVGMGVAMGGGMGGLGQMQQQPLQNPMMGQMPQQQVPVAAAVAPAAPAADAWTCACGATVTGKFCMNCGAKKPEPVAATGWTCSCGSVNEGNFCANCGAKKPAQATKFVCDKCGFESDNVNMKFCPNCGDGATADDLK